MERWVQQSHQIKQTVSKRNSRVLTAIVWFVRTTLLVDEFRDSDVLPRHELRNCVAEDYLGATSVELGLVQHAASPSLFLLLTTEKTNHDIA